MPTMRPAPARRMCGIYRAQNVKRAVEIQLEHAFERGVISLGNRRAAGNPPTRSARMRSRPNRAAIPSTRVCAGSARERSAERRRRGRSVRTRRPSASGNADHSSSAIHKGSREASAEHAVGSGGQRNFPPGKLCPLDCLMAKRLAAHVRACAWYAEL
jgi:hypothetical protein